MIQLNSDKSYLRRVTLIQSRSTSFLLDVGTGVGYRGEEPGKIQQHSLISKYLSIMGSPKLFRLAKFALKNLS